MSETYIPASALRMAIVMVNAADQCDQAGQWDRDHRRACKHILDWIGSNDYKITCEKAGASDPVRHGRWIEYSRNADETYIECSNCCVASRPRHLQMVTRTGSGLPDYCPNCGADMRGVSEDAGSKTD